MAGPVKSFTSNGSPVGVNVTTVTKVSDAGGSTSLIEFVGESGTQQSALVSGTVAATITTLNT